MTKETPFTSYAIQRAIGVTPDGWWGKETEAAARAFLGNPKDDTRRPWGRKRLILGVQQKMMRDAGIIIDVDGVFGQATEVAFERYRSLPPDTPKRQVIEAGMDFGILRRFWAWIRSTPDADPVPPVILPPDKPPASAPTPAPVKPPVTSPAPNVWPRQKDVPDFYGDKGANQVIVTCPWQMELSWDASVKTRKISLHKSVAPSAERALKAIYEHYGDEGVRKLGLHRYGGSLNVRKMRGSEAWSMHSWGIAIDWDPDNNQLSWDHTKARLAKPDAEAFWRIWEAEGWVSLGRERDYDWMHIQAARL